MHFFAQNHVYRSQCFSKTGFTERGFNNTNTTGGEALDGPRTRQWSSNGLRFVSGVTSSLVQESLCIEATESGRHLHGSCDGAYFQQGLSYA